MSGPIGRFGLVIHPQNIADFTKRFPFTRLLPGGLVERMFQVVPPFEASHITGIVSATGARAEGWFIALPWTPRVLLATPPEVTYPRLIQAGRIAERLGAGIVGLAAFTKVVGDRGVSVARALDAGVTTGNSLTAATAVEGALVAASRMGLDPRAARVAVIGATGSIGGACSQMLAPQVGELVLVARTRDRLERLAGRLRETATTPVSITSDVRAAVGAADIVLTVSSAIDVLIEPEDLRPGAVVCDVARPRNVSRLVYERRRDVLVIDGGVIDVPGPVDFGLDFGFPPGTCEACMAETILLALEHRYDDYTLGPEIELAKAEEIHALMRKHGFRLTGLRRFERKISDEELDAIRAAARGARPHVAVPRGGARDAVVPEGL
ncbi:MAG TPA: shikimate dehydrogenase [bacterium]|nr:shikimate dehydrogenase [bacterium]